MTEPRPIRDILAESLRRERLGLVRPLWAAWCEFDDAGGPEQWRLRADHLMRILAELGVSLVRNGDELPALPPPTATTIFRAAIVGRNAERVIRRQAGGWSIITIEDGKETVEQTFTVQEALLNGGLVLTDHPDAKKIPGLGRQLAALNEAYRVDAISMGDAA